MLSLGIDIGGSSVKLAAIRDRDMVWTSQSSSYSRPNRDQLVAAIRQAAEGRAINADVAGICVPGILDPSTRTITLAVNVPGLVGIPLDKLVHAAFGNAIARLHIVNDARAAATDIVETRSLNGRILTLVLGTGVGIGVLDEGKPLLINDDSPGHIGQIDVSIDSGEIPVGPDGGAGSLEAYIGAPALIRRYGSMETFFKNAKITEPPLRALVRAIRVCHAIYRPDHVVLAGGVGIRLKGLITELKGSIDTNLTSVAKANWILSCGDHDFHAAIGAARLAMKG
jgi:predicted NBD/HSP70 family sugar kinase